MSCGEGGNHHIGFVAGFNELVGILVVYFDDVIVDNISVHDSYFVAWQKVKVISWIRDQYHLGHVGTLCKLSYSNTEIKKIRKKTRATALCCS